MMGFVKTRRKKIVIVHFEEDNHYFYLRLPAA